MPPSDDRKTVRAEDLTAEAARALLEWHFDMGIAEPVGDRPLDWRGAAFGGPAPKPARDSPAAARPPSAQAGAGAAAREAERIARGCADFDALFAAIRAFEGCALKKTAHSTVICDGVRGADLLVIGEAPGRDEDRQGKPFVGRAGKLLDAMLAAIGRSRDANVLISNVIFWRPPGNRTPSAEERAICLPFAERLIELAAPKCLLMVGGVSAQTLLRVTTGVMRLRGSWRDYETPSGRKIPAMATLHPAFLLRQAAQKRLAWRDLMNLEARLTQG
ncbi:MAG: hypothetical protein Tsb0010_14070 [Parvularculaceae bacterium]